MTQTQRISDADIDAALASLHAQDAKTDAIADGAELPMTDLERKEALAFLADNPITKMLVGARTESATSLAVA